MYVGAIPTTGDFKKLDAITASATATYNLTQGGVAVYPQSSSHCLVVLNGILQTGGSSFNIVNDTIVFSEALTSSDVINQILVLGNVNDIGVVSDDTVSTAKLQANAVTTAKITDGNVTAAKIASGVIPTSRPNVSPIIINGNCAVAQRSTNVSTTAGGYKTVDRLQFNTSSTTGNATFTQENDAPSNTAFRKSMKITPNATESMSASKNILFTYAIEGQDVQVLQHGSASPPKATLSFWVKSSKTGVYCVQVKEESISNESYVLFEYTISQANTWEQKVFSWTGNSAHTLNNDNAMGMRLCFHLASGSDDHRSATTSWVDDSSYRTTANQVNFFDSTSNTWYITGIQLEVGEFTSSTLPDFQHEDFGDNLIRCQRYFQTLDNQSGQMYSSGTGRIHSTLSPRMRTSPSQSTSASYTNAIEDVGVANLSPSSISLASSSTDHIAFNAGGLSSTTRNMILLKIKMEINSEL